MLAKWSNTILGTSNTKLPLSLFSDLNNVMITLTSENDMRDGIWTLKKNNIIIKSGTVPYYDDAVHIVSLRLFEEFRDLTLNGNAILSQLVAHIERDTTLDISGTVNSSGSLIVSANNTEVELNAANSTIEGAVNGTVDGSGNLSGNLNGSVTMSLYGSLSNSGSGSYDSTDSINISGNSLSQIEEIVFEAGVENNFTITGSLANGNDSTEENLIADTIYLQFNGNVKVSVTALI